MFHLSLLIFLIATFSFLYFTCHVYYNHCKMRKVPGPPRTNFFLGNIVELLDGFNKDETGFGLLEKYVDQFGGLFVIWLAVKPIVIICDAEAVKSTVYDNSHPKEHRRPEAFLFGKRFCGGESIFTNPGNLYWKNNRKLFSRLFSKHFLREYIERIELVAGRLIEKLRSEGDGVVDLDRWFNMAACDIIGLVAFSWDIDSISSSDPKFINYLCDALRGCALSGLPWTRIVPWKAGERRRARDAVDALRVHCRNILRSREEEIHVEDLLSVIAQLDVDEEQKVDEVLAFFLAGQETVAHTITFAASHVMRDNAILNPLLSEIEEVFDKGISYESISGMKEMECLMKETLRHYAPVPGLRRVLARDSEICGYMVPKDTVVVHLLYLYGQDKKTWSENRRDFMPMRFYPAETEGVMNARTRYSELGGERHKYSFLPFGVGPRTCIGKDLAKLEFKVLLSYVLKNFTLTPVPGERVVQMRYVSVKPKSGYMCYLTPRA